MISENSTPLLIEKLQNQDRRALAKLLTLVEQNTDTHGNEVAEVMSALPHATKPTWRIGITGPPGVGKSSLIEVLGLALIATGKKVAVLAVDPTSKKSGGSILGDKIRMPELSLHADAFVRPSASRLHPGGTAQATNNTVRVCEAAGYDVVLIETVGVGQGETEVSEVVDLFLLLVMPNAGDEVQGVKRGIMEMADVIVVTKSDLDTAASSVALAQYTSALRLFMSDKEYWTPKAFCTSSVSKTGFDELVACIEEYFSPNNNSSIVARRKEQSLVWFKREAANNVVRHVLADERVSAKMELEMNRIRTNNTEPSVAVHSFTTWFTERFK